MREIFFERNLKLLLLVLLITILLIFPTYNSKLIKSFNNQQSTDWGDAPEAAIAYPDIGVIGAFPTCIQMGPSSFIRHGNYYMWLGLTYDSEGDGNAGLCVFPPYDKDECFQDGDAGLVIPEPFTIDPNMNIVPCSNSKGTTLGNTCSTAIWGRNIDILVQNKFRDTAYFHLLIDWNRDGKWLGTTTCPGTLAPIVVSEHVLLNFPIPAGFSGLVSQLQPPNFLIGPKSGYVWARFSITESKVPANWEGYGAFEDGETEDYLLKIGEVTQEKPTLNLEIEPSNCQLHQDETAYVLATLKDSLGNPISGVKIDFKINPAESNNIRNYGWYESPSPNSTLHYGITNLSGIVRMCIGTKNAETITVTATCTVGTTTLTKSVNLNFLPRPKEVKATLFVSTGDFISNWYWLRDTGYTQFAEWTFTGITSCPNYLLLRSTHLVTDKPSGGRGYSARVTYKFFHPVTGTLLGAYKDYLLNLWSPADNTSDSTGYKTIGSICVPSSYVINGTLKVRIERFSANTEHVGVNMDSLILKMCEVCEKGGIKGTVGKNCAGAKIEIKNANTGVIVWSSNTDSNGNYDTCNTLNPGDYIVTPSLLGYSFNPANRKVTVTPCTKIEANFECIQEKFGGIIGKIIDSHIETGASGKPCSKVKVYISGPVPLTVVAWSGYTDDNGVFDTCFTLRPGKYIVVPELSCEPSSKEVEVTSDKKTEVTFICKCFGGIKGYIGCSEGPCKNVLVEIYDSNSNLVWTGKTDEKGNYDTCYNLPKGTYTVKPKLENCKFIPESQKVEVIACSKQTVDFKCDCCFICTKGGIIGKIICRDENNIYPCENITVNIYDISGNLIRIEITDKDGKFDTCHNLPPGKYKVVPVQPDYCKIIPESKEVDVKACEKTEINFECDCCIKKKLGGIEGTISDYSNKPCTGVTVVVVGPLPLTSVAWFGKTDINGKYSTCLNLTPGDYIIYAKLPCESNEIKVTVSAGIHKLVNFKCKCELKEKEVPLWLNPPSESVLPNTIFKKSVEIGKPGLPVTNLMAFKLTIKFDPNLFEVIRVIEGGFLKTGGASTIFLPYIDNTNGRIVINSSRLGGTGVSGFGTLLYLVIKVKNVTGLINTEFALPEAESDLRDKDNNIITHYNENEKVEIGKEKEIVGDFNKDGKINLEDLVIFSLAFNKKKGDPGWEGLNIYPGAPFNRCDIWDSSRMSGVPPVTEKRPDGIVDFNDLMVFIVNWNFYYIP